MIQTCEKCGGLFATENFEMFAGTPCLCGHRIAKKITAQVEITSTDGLGGLRGITGEEVWEIHELCQLVITSRQNVGHKMTDQAKKVLGITQRLASTKPPNDRTHVSQEAK